MRIGKTACGKSIGGFRNWCIYGCWDAPRNGGEGLLIKRTFFEDTAKVRLYFFLPKLFEGNFATRTDEPAPRNPVIRYGTTCCNGKTIVLKIYSFDIDTLLLGKKPDQCPVRTLWTRPMTGRGPGWRMPLHGSTCSHPPRFPNAGRLCRNGGDMGANRGRHGGEEGQHCPNSQATQEPFYCPLDVFSKCFKPSD